MRALTQFEQRFATEGACRAYLARLRWPSGFRCPQCKTNGSWTTTRNLMMCRGCGHQASVTAGTIFHRTRIPLQDWFRAIWWMTDQKHRLSALGLQRLLGLGSYRTAWLWLQKLQRATVRPSCDRLGGQVEIDKTYLGVASSREGRRKLGNKILVAIAAQIDGKGIGRIHLRRMPSTSASPLVAFVEEAVKPGSVVITDAGDVYTGLTQKGLNYRPRVINAGGQTSTIALPRVHRVAALFNRWLIGAHQGALSREQLDTYLEEFTVLFNRRTSKYRWKQFSRFVAQAVAVETVHFPKLIAGSV